MRLFRPLLALALSTPVFVVACSSSGHEPSTSEEDSITASPSPTTVDACLVEAPDFVFDGTKPPYDFHSNGAAYASTACGAMNVKITTPATCAIGIALPSVSQAECAATHYTITAIARTHGHESCGKTIWSPCKWIPGDEVVLWTHDGTPTWNHYDAGLAPAASDSGSAAPPVIYGCQVYDAAGFRELDPSLYDDVRVIAVANGTSPSPVEVSCVPWR